MMRRRAPAGRFSAPKPQAVRRDAGVPVARAKFGIRNKWDGEIDLGVEGKTFRFRNPRRISLSASQRLIDLGERESAVLAEGGPNTIDRQRKLIDIMIDHIAIYCEDGVADVLRADPEAFPPDELRALLTHIRETYVEGDAADPLASASPEPSTLTGSLPG